MMKNLQRALYEDSINYVSPLRAHPKRYYMLDKAKMTISLDTLDGDAIAEVLKENKSLKKKVNDWFSKFGFKIDVEVFKEVIHQMHVSQNGLTLDITDVGFGISQVLPIIIQGFLSSDESITIIEQPEIHLHPKMQADLGDLFIDIVNTDDKKLIVETHSEYFLRRIRRRISEGKISNKDVSICLFHPKKGDSPAWVENLEIQEKGGFEWPEDFYGGELYNDTLEYLKNQM
jgi:predicted ATPase